MSRDEIYNYLTDESHWLIITDDYQKAENNHNFKYDPVNVGTYNYCSYETSIPGHDKPEDKRLHSILDVLPYRDDGGNWGNVIGLIYGNSMSARNYNGEYHDTHSLIDIYKKYEDEQDEVFVYWEKYLNRRM